MRLRHFTSIMLLALLFIIAGKQVYPHCEIPCGIYDDEMRYDMLEEHITTIEKSMTMIGELSEEGEKNYNQIVRWVTNKDNHADQFSNIVQQYFLTQRIKPVEKDAGQAYEDYITHLKFFHEMLFYAMKCKQTRDIAHTAKLKELVEKSRALYFKK